MSDAVDTFELTIDSVTTKLRVVSFTGTERMSKAYSFEILVAAPRDVDLLGQQLLGKAARLTLKIDSGVDRAISGIVAAIEPDASTRADGLHAHRVRLVARFWLLKKRITSRIFQNMTVPAIVGAVLDKAGIPYTFELTRPHPTREYCVQYQESDHAFVRRLIAEEGIFFFFALPAASKPVTEAETVVFVDTPSAYRKAPQTDSNIPEDTPLCLVDRALADLPTSTDVSGFRVRGSLEPMSVLLRDYDFVRPHLDLRETARVAPELASAPATGAGLEVYEHRGEYGVPQVDPDRAEVVLQAYRRGAVVGGGESACRTLSPGYTFFVGNTDYSTLNLDAVATRVDHEGNVPELTTKGARVYKNRFECVPETVPYRAKRPKREFKQVLEPAVVVGPSGEEIYTDGYGRIRVKFPWDLEGKDDGTSSCWIRVVQSWAGSGWGTQFIPRIGMEVMVGFLSGDQDCPVIMGTVYNATHPPSFGLPASRSQSGLRTASYPGGGGSNELLFDDAKDKEQFYMRAQRDLDKVVERNHTSWVKGEEQIRVDAKQSLTVNGDQNEFVAGNATRDYAQNETVRVAGNRTDLVVRDADVRVAGKRETRLGSEVHTVSGRSDVELGADHTVRSKGNMTTIVGKSDARRSYVLHVEGHSQLSTSDTFDIEGEKSLVLRCGESFIKIGPEKIELVSKTITATAKDASLEMDAGNVRLFGKKQSTLKFDEVIVKSSGASLGLKSEVQIDGSKILMNSPQDVQDPTKDESPPITKIRLAGESGEPHAYRRFVIQLKEGGEYSGVLDEDGTAELAFKASGKIHFADLSEPAKENAPLQPHVVRQGEFLSKLAARLGFDPDKVWNAPENAELKKLRPDPDILFPGDVLHVPKKGEPKLEDVVGGTTNEYKAPAGLRESKCAFIGDDDKPLANADCEVSGLRGGAAVPMKTDGDGVLTLWVPVTVREITVHFPKAERTYRLMIGEMDPIEERAGVVKRLENLGYLPDTSQDTDDEIVAALAIALRAFQKRHGLVVSGELDDQTRDAIVAAYGL